MDQGKKLIANSEKIPQNDASRLNPTVSCGADRWQKSTSNLKHLYLHVHVQETTQELCALKMI